MFYNVEWIDREGNTLRCTRGFAERRSAEEFVTIMEITSPFIRHAQVVEQLEMELEDAV